MATTTLSNPEKRERLTELTSSFDTAMLVTHTQEGRLHSRPLSVAHNEDDPERLYFSTAIESEKVAELDANPDANVSMQGKRRFVSISGKVTISRDPALIDKLWSESWRIWFPEGKDDPSLCVLIVDPSEASYWDASGAQGIKYLFEMAKAYVTGTRPSSDADERHVAEVELNH